MTPLMRLFPALGRMLLSLIFIAIGIVKIRGWDGFLGIMADKGLMAAPVLLGLSIAVEILLGALLLVGWRARSSALGLLAYLVAVTAVFHDFRGVPEVQAQLELVNFLKNIAIMGGLLFVVAFGAGPFSVDSILRRRRFDSQPGPGGQQSAAPQAAPPAPEQSGG